MSARRGGIGLAVVAGLAGPLAKGAGAPPRDVRQLSHTQSEQEQNELGQSEMGQSEMGQSSRGGGGCSLSPSRWWT